MNAISKDGVSLTGGIAGIGRLGVALAAALDAAGYSPLLLATRHANPASVAGEFTDPTAFIARCDVVFLTVPDDAIEEVAGGYSWRAGQIVAHCSGARGLDVLAAVSALGAGIGCLHPIQTFPPHLSAEQAAARFRGIVCGIEGDGEVGDVLEMLARELGASIVRLEGVDRAAYHAAAVLAGNDVVALASAAARAWSHAGLPIERARDALAPLIRASADGIAELPLEQALTGPIARGDVATVERHLRALAEDPELLDLYRKLALELLTLDLGHEPKLQLALQRALRD